MYVNRRGAKSRAGFTGKPQLNPYATPIANRANPTISGSIPLTGLEFLLSVIAQMQATSRAVPRICNDSKYCKIVLAVKINIMPSDPRIKNAVCANIEHNRYFHYTSNFRSIHSHGQKSHGPVMFDTVEAH